MLGWAAMSDPTGILFATVGMMALIAAIFAWAHQDNSRFEELFFFGFAFTALLFVPFGIGIISSGALHLFMNKDAALEAKMQRTALEGGAFVSKSSPRRKINLN